MADNPIGIGRTAEIFDWQAGRVLKLYRDWCRPEWVEQEARLTRAVHAVGLPVPAVLAVIEKDGRRGIVFEQISGPSMLADFSAKPWHLIRAARLLAELHAAMHAHEIPNLPSVRESLTYRIENTTLAQATKSAALTALAQLPDGQAICHGDFHPDNVLLSPRGPVIIDWMTVNGGHPLADVARTSLILRIGNPPPGLGRRLFELVRNLFHTQYLKRYMRLRQVTRDEIEAWHLPVAVARTLEDIPNERQALAALIETLMARVQPD
jgi:aminoglycoside phosphotransferase (APT) family kinase protein